MTNEVIEMRRPQKVLLRMGLASIAVSVLVLAGALAFGGGRLRGFAVDSDSPNASTERVVIAVEGMYCDSCAAGIRAMLKRTPGVIAADVSYQKKEAVVDYDARKTTPEKIAQAINNLGYKASVKNKS